MASTDQTRKLADEIRALIETLTTVDVPPDGADAATRLVRQAHEGLGGPPAPRWYDHDDAFAGRTGASDAFGAQSPFRGAENPVAPPMVLGDVTRPDGRQVVEGRVRLSHAYEGPPRGVHGGWVAGLFDDVLGATQHFVADGGLTGKLTVRYRQITPIDTDLLFEAWIERDAGRRITSRATCTAGEVVTAEAEALFIRVEFEDLRDPTSPRPG